MAAWDAPRDPTHYEPSDRAVEAARDGLCHAAEQAMSRAESWQLRQHAEPLARAALRRALAPSSVSSFGWLLTYEHHRAERHKLRDEIARLRRQVAAVQVDADHKIVDACRTRDAALSLLPEGAAVDDPALKWAARELGCQAVLAAATDRARDILNAAVVEVTVAQPDAVTVAQVQRALERARKQARRVLDQAHATCKAEREATYLAGADLVPVDPSVVHEAGLPMAVIDPDPEEARS